MDISKVRSRLRSEGAIAAGACAPASVRACEGAAPSVMDSGLPPRTLPLQSSRPAVTEAGCMRSIRQVLTMGRAAIDWAYARSYDYAAGPGATWLRIECEVAAALDLIRWLEAKR